MFSPFIVKGHFWILKDYKSFCMFCSGRAMFLLNNCLPGMRKLYSQFVESLLSYLKSYLRFHKSCSF